MDKNKLEGSSLNKQEEILNFLKSDLPEIFSEGKIDCKKLKQTLGEEVDDGNERYGLSWAGKNNCFKVIQEQTTATLKPVKGESVDFDQTQNLFIEGDNLEVLKVLQRSYYGKIKMIYIDPPYNTGNDFIYNDKFQENRDEYLESIGEKDDIGNTLRIDGLSKNAKDNGHYHSKWLNMMYPRLFLAKNLLKQDGVIFVSIDDNEVKNLRMITDEIFGEENFVAQIIWERAFSPKNDSKYFSENHDYILVYARNIEEFSLGKLDRTREANARYKNVDNDSRGLWTSGDLSVKSYSKEYDYIINTPSGKEIKPPHGSCWRVSMEKLKELIEDNRIWFGEDGNNVPRLKRFLTEVSDGMVPTTLWKHRDVGHNQEGRQELKALFDDRGYFDGPKPVKLITRMLQLSTSKNLDDLVLDFFSGSGTTAHAVMELNSEDGGNRKWICVQLPELCDEESEAYKAGYKNIAEIGKERIRRAGDKIGKDNKNKVDFGFKSLKLDKSNFKIWQGKFENTESLLSNMADFVDNVKSGSKEENILFELILKSGLDLNVPIEEKELGGDKYYLLDDGKLIVYLGKKITEEMAEEIQKSKPEKFICLDGCFQNNDQLKTNISLQMEQEKIDFKVI